MNDTAKKPWDEIAKARQELAEHRYRRMVERGEQRWHTPEYLKRHLDRRRRS